jgi:hypothetical protein
VSKNAAIVLADERLDVLLQHLSHSLHCCSVLRQYESRQDNPRIPTQKFCFICNRASENRSHACAEKCSIRFYLSTRASGTGKKRGKASFPPIVRSHIAGDSPERYGARDSGRTAPRTPGRILSRCGSLPQLVSTHACRHCFLCLAYRTETQADRLRSSARKGSR